MKKLPLQGRTLALLAVIIPLLVLFIYVGLRSGPLAPVAVTVASVESRAITPALFGIGTVEARYTYKIGPTFAGRVKRLEVHVGDQVKAGQVLGEMEQIVLSWPGYFSATAPIHKAIAALEVGSPLVLRPRSDGKPGWEVADSNGVAVTRMAQKFVPPSGKIIEVRVAAILATKATEGDAESLRCKSWELVLPEVEYLL